MLLPAAVACEMVLLAVMLALALAGLLGVVVDRRRRLLRLAAMGASYIVVEMATLALFFGSWLARPVTGPERAGKTDLRLLAWALGRILAAARHTVGFQISLQEPPPGSPSLSLLTGEEPVLVLARHGGIGDSFSLVWLLAHRYRRRPRIVLKGVLLWEPLLDVALTRMNACFLPRNAPAGETPGARVGALCAGLQPGDALLLFPEGGNWTPARRLRAMSRLWAARKSAALKAAALMEHVMAPRTGGVLACLKARPGLPVVVVAHTGLDEIVSAGQLWRAVPFTTPMSVTWWPAPPAPAGDEERTAWLTTEWAVVDEWIAARRSVRR